MGRLLDPPDPGPTGPPVTVRVDVADQHPLDPRLPDPTTVLVDRDLYHWAVDFGVRTEGVMREFYRLFQAFGLLPAWLAIALAYSVAGGAAFRAFCIECAALQSTRCWFGLRCTSKRTGVALAVA